MKTPAVVGIIVFALTLLSNMAAQAEDAQELNPLFLEVSDLSEQLSASSLNDNAKTAWSMRFDGLKQVQQELFNLGGQVNSGQCREGCIDLYNSRVSSWESSLQSFSHDANLALHAQQGDPTSKYKCWGDCDRKHTSCWSRCLDGPIEENEPCHKACNEEKTQCVNAC